MFTGLTTGTRCEIDRASIPGDGSSGCDGFAVPKILAWLGFIKQGGLRARSQTRQTHDKVCHHGTVEIVLPNFYYPYGKRRVGLRQTSCNDTCSGAV